MRWFLLGAALGFASSAAVAFQETKGGQAQEQTKAPLDLSGTGTSIDNSPSQGIEIRIPGLGKLGVLPKLDFGLELLYGVNDANKDQGPQEKLRQGQEEDAKIRGSLKHRF